MLRVDTREVGVLRCDDCVVQPGRDVIECIAAALAGAGKERGIRLDDDEFRDLVTFVRDGLFDPRVADFCRLIPDRVPSGATPMFRPM